MCGLTLVCLEVIIFLIVFRILFYFIESCKRLHFGLFYFLVEYLFFEFMQNKILHYEKGNKNTSRKKKW
jgi:hypothetical protein